MPFHKKLKRKILKPIRKRYYKQNKRGKMRFKIDRVEKDINTAIQVGIAAAMGYQMGGVPGVVAQEYAVYERRKRYYNTGTKPQSRRRYYRNFKRYQNYDNVNI